MNPASRQQHWNDVYARKREDEVSWFEPTAALSLELIERCTPPRDARIIDVGGGASHLVDGLLARGFEDLTVLDLSSEALAKARARLGERAARVHWITADVTTFEPSVRYALWHDRAVFHFLTAPSDRSAYVNALERALEPGGHAIVGTFAPDGPERCSGLDVVRYDGPGLAAALGPSFALIEAIRHEHVTPAGKVQPFTFARFVRASAA
ncbi:MAG TPA: class I SAM-dependent methyltransferase [Polyangiaceae bacterium]